MFYVGERSIYVGDVIYVGERIIYVGERRKTEFTWGNVFYVGERKIYVGERSIYVGEPKSLKNIKKYKKNWINFGAFWLISLFPSPC